MKRNVIVLLLLVCAGAVGLRAQAPLSEYAARRARLLEEVQAPVVLFGYGGEPFGIVGTERMFPETTFRQEENFYYLSGHREPGAALLLIPQTAQAHAAELPAEILFLPARDPRKALWQGPRLGPDEPGVEAKTGFAAVEPFEALPDELQRVEAVFPKLLTLLPASGDDPQCSHEGRWTGWLREKLPDSSLGDVRETLGALRQVKSPAEQALLRRSVERTEEAFRAVMSALRPGMHEYELAALAEYTYKRAGCERSGFAPIVASGPNATVIHYDQLKRKMQAGELVLLDLGAECDAYTADLSRTLPVSGKFTERQKKIYEIVLGAQNAVLAAVRPGMTLSRTGENSLHKIAVEYLDKEGERVLGEPLGKYFLHSIGHHIGLEVHDAGPRDRPLEPGMVVMVEPGVYLPEENLGIRLEDVVLVTEDGGELLTADLPRTVEEIERTMAEAKTPR